jgi:hypothetical protein
MRNRLCKLLVLMAGLVIWSAEYGLVYGEQPVVASESEMVKRSVASTVFAHSVPTDYQLVQAGKLQEQAGNGNFLVLDSNSKHTKVVIVALEKLSWLKTKKIESASAEKVGKQLVTQFFPELQSVTITEEPQDKGSTQYASRLRIAHRQGIVKPAIALRLIYPKNKAYVLLLWKQGNIYRFSQAYADLEAQAKVIIRELREPSQVNDQFSERYMLRRLRHIFKNGVFTHLVKPNVQE